jgi:RNA polymerase sigma factor (sigma-70 family)
VIGGMAYDDLAQEGRIAVWKSVMKYDPQRGARFSTYAWVAIRRRVWQAVRHADQSYLWVEEEALWLQAHEIAETACWLDEIRQALLVAVARLPCRLRAVILRVYGLDDQPACTMAALGRQWGVTRERIRQLRNDALVLLRLPAFSAEVRDLCDQSSREAYRDCLALNRDWLARVRRS